MKMSILEIGYENIRRISELKLSFTKEDGSIIKNSFIMMANGTGKTTTMTLLKGLLSESATYWDYEMIHSFAPESGSDKNGMFYITVKFDEKQYKYFLLLDYKWGTTKIETVVPSRGREEGRILPEALQNIFTDDFVSRFIFDGEQALKIMDSASNEAAETIKYLYRLDILEEIKDINQEILDNIQNRENVKGTELSVKQFRTKQKTLNKKIAELEKEKDSLIKKRKKREEEKTEKETKRAQIDAKFEKLNTDKHKIEAEQENNNSAIDITINEIINLIKLPYLLDKNLCERMYELGSNMTKLKLPKTISKDFFEELAHESTCVCGRCIGEKEKKEILLNAKRYLGSDDQSMLNQIKTTLRESKYDNRLDNAFEQLKNQIEAANTLKNRLKNAEKALRDAGGKEAKELYDQIAEIARDITITEVALNRIKSTDESDDSLDETNNIHKAKLALKSCEDKLASQIRCNSALQKKRIIEKLVEDIKKKATEELKSEIIQKTNLKIQKAISDDDIEIENIGQYIKLKGKSGASEGQTLSIAYCFIGTLFEDAELVFPFIIDSPTGKMDFDKRKAIADIIPTVFNHQMIAFVQSAEVANFANRFYQEADTQYFTIIADSKTKEVEKHEGIEFFDSYQKEHRGEEVV